MTLVLGDLHFEATQRLNPGVRLIKPSWVESLPMQVPLLDRLIEPRRGKRRKRPILCKPSAVEIVRASTQRTKVRAILVAIGLTEVVAGCAGRRIQAKRVGARSRSGGGEE
jgi:hypothetical protein